MNNYPFEKKSAFFPFVTAEVFFEAEDAEVDVTALGSLDADLDAELDDILATN